MKIEKGKLYYHTDTGKVVKSEEDGFIKWGSETRKVKDVTYFSDKIAVHCPTIKDWEYVNNVISDHWRFASKFTYRLLDNYDHRYDILTATEQGYKIISIEEFKKFYPESDKGVKQSSNKLNYELDFEFIKQMAERMQTNKGKYDPYNWKKPIEVHELQQAIFRHVVEIMKGNYEDDGRELGHLESLACNAMMLNYQIKK